MPCGLGSPIATQLGAGTTACQIIQSTNPDLDEIKLQLRRTINYLVGDKAKETFDKTAGGLRYESSKLPGHPEEPSLGQGIIADLNTVLNSGGKHPYRLKSPSAEVALQAARSAQKLAERGLTQNDISSLHQTAKDVETQLQIAFKAILAP